MILVTGSTGFVGTALCVTLSEKGIDYVPAVRNASIKLPNSENHVPINLLDSNEDLSEVLRNVDVIVHLAGRAHIMHDTAVDPLAEFRKVNTKAVLSLANRASTHGIKRFIFISSVKVNGESTIDGKPFTPILSQLPKDPYGISKYEAEVGLKEIADRTNMEIVVIRPPLIYGPGVKANFKNMMHWLCKGIPLPFGSISNKRSIVSIDNLVDLIITCADHPFAANETFMVSDDQDVSTSELLTMLASALEVPNRLFSVPVGMLRFLAKLIRKEDVINRLCNSLQVDITHTKNTLDWQPPYNTQITLKKTANNFRQQEL